MSNHIKTTKLSFFKKETNFQPSILIPSGSRQFPLLITFSVLLFICAFFSGTSTSYSQTTYQPNYFTGNQPTTNNYLLNSSAFKQEIARVEINVVRGDSEPLPITQVPRLEKNDILKIRLLEEQVNGMKPDQSNWNWTFLVAYINPARNNEREKSVSEEIQFRKTGWYKEYSFAVPYDSQPIFFLYSKPNYRDKILNLINKNQDDIRKIGEKTLELSSAYAKINSFLNELQFIVNRGSIGGIYGSYGGYGNTYGSGYGSTYGSSYGGYGSYYGGYNNYGTTGSTDFNLNMFMDQTVERVARSFNIQLPTCWQSGISGYGGYNTYNSYGTNSYGTQQPSFLGINQDFVGRLQCVAKSVRIEDFDLSVSRMLQQGGMLAAAQLAQKYPQLAFWINVAAAALDFIMKVTRKAPLKIVPTVTSSSDNLNSNFGYQANFSPQTTLPNSNQRPNAVKISLFAEAPPNDNGFVTAYPLVVNKWQPNPDPELIALPTPVLKDQCLHAGQNILKSTDLMNDWMTDNFTKDFQLVISSANGFKQQFPLKKNIGFGGWELNLTKEDLNSFPKINLALESVVVGKRGFNEIRSPKFDLPIPMGNDWQIESASQKDFSVGGKRVVTLKNKSGSCKCLQAVVYKPSFGGQFIFDVNNKENSLVFSPDGKSASFQIDVTNFQAGAGKLELRQLDGEAANLNINLYPAPPNVAELKIAQGDSQAVLKGERLEQIRAIKINGSRAILVESSEKTPTSAPQNAFNNVSAQSEKVFVFENANEKLASNNMSLELELEDNRAFQYPETFQATLARPAIVANASKEVEAAALDKSNRDNNGSENKDTPKAATTSSKINSQIPLDGLPVFPVKTSEVALIVRNALNDYGFRVENLQIETRIENSRIDSSELPKTDFEVLDQKRMRISFLLNEQTQKLLAGRRLQFRIRDKERGNSDWYSIQKTFVRTPENIAVKCTKEMKGRCELSGDGVEYISQVSVDGGKTWFPEQAGALTVQPKSDGQNVVMIPFFANKKLLQIKLGDFPASNGLLISDYKFLNTVQTKAHNLNL